MCVQRFCLYYPRIDPTNGRPDSLPRNRLVHGRVDIVAGRALRLHIEMLTRLLRDLQGYTGISWTWSCRASLEGMEKSMINTMFEAEG